jgi:hypothetical protein
MFLPNRCLANGLWLLYFAILALRRHVTIHTPIFNQCFLFLHPNTLIISVSAMVFLNFLDTSICGPALSLLHVMHILGVPTLQLPGTFIGLSCSSEESGPTRSSVKDIFMGHQHNN